MCFQKKILVTLWMNGIIGHLMLYLQTFCVIPSLTRANRSALEMSIAHKHHTKSCFPARRGPTVTKKTLEIRNIFMAALRSRCGHYIFALWFLSIFYLFYSSFVSDIAIFVLKRDVKLQLTNFYSSLNLSGRRLDVYHTSTHGVVLVRI